MSNPQEAEALCQSVACEYDADFVEEHLGGYSEPSVSTQEATGVEDGRIRELAILVLVVGVDVLLPSVNPPGDDSPHSQRAEPEPEAHS